MSSSSSLIPAEGGPLSFALLQRIQCMKGNDHCFDCNAVDPDWASVTNGTLVCLKCAGRHRTLGVHVSRIKSMTMDSWEPQHIISMLLGGNAQLKGFFKRQRVQNTAIETLYTKIKAAEFYRKELTNQVTKEMEKYEGGKECILDQIPEVTECKEGERPALIATDDDARKSQHFVAVIEEQDLGIILSKEITPFGGLARVSKLVEGGAGATAGVVVGDYIIGAGGVMNRNYDDLMRILSSTPTRPLHLTIRRPGEIVQLRGPVPTTPRSPSDKSNRPIVQRGPKKTAVEAERAEENDSTDVAASSEAEPIEEGSEAVVDCNAESVDPLKTVNDDSSSEDDAPSDEENTEEGEVDETKQLEIAAAKLALEESSKDLPPPVVEVGKMVDVKNRHGDKIRRAKIVKLYDDDTVKVRYRSDKTEERHVPLSRLQSPSSVAGPADRDVPRREQDDDVVEDSSLDEDVPAWARSFKQAENDLAQADQPNWMAPPQHPGMPQQQPYSPQQQMYQQPPYPPQQQQQYPPYPQQQQQYGAAPFPGYGTPAPRGPPPGSAVEVISNFLNALSGQQVNPSSSSPSPYPPSMIQQQQQQPQGYPYQPHASQPTLMHSQSAPPNFELPSGEEDEYEVTFSAARMGFRIQKLATGEAMVAHVVPYEAASAGGVCVGDTLVAMDGYRMTDYDRIMYYLPRAPRPLRLTFKKGHRMTSPPARLNNDPATQVSIGSNDLAMRPRAQPAPLPSQLMANPPERRVGELPTRRPPGNPYGPPQPPAYPGMFPVQTGYGAQYAFPQAIVPPSGSSMSTRVDLGSLTDEDEVDVTFMDGSLGMRLDERGGLVPVSVVTNIVPGGQAELAGVEIGCTVLGVNGERFISHAHTIATVQHGKRPIRIRFRFPDRPSL